MWLIAIIAAAICNSIMDCLYSERIGITDFHDNDQAFWNKDVSAHNAKMIGKYRIDAWHLLKSSMIILWAVAVILYHYTWWWSVGNAWIDIPKDLIFAGLAWNLPFNLFYNKVWKKGN